MAIKKTELTASVGRHLNFTAGRMNALCQKLLDPHEISLPQWVILSCLWREGDLTVSGLTGRIGTGLPATSRLVDRMEERGLVTRHRDTVDGRAILVRVTEKGQALSHLRDFHERINDMLFAGFTQEERALAFGLLVRMQRNAEAALE
jgi:DNA-binding MarR family transcriptional regulator